MTRQRVGDQDRVIIYTDQKGRSRWRMRAAGNGSNLANAGQSYRRDADLFKNIKRVTGRWVCFDPDAARTMVRDFILTIDERTP